MNEWISMGLRCMMIWASAPLFAGLDPVFFERLAYWPEVENTLGLVSLAENGNQSVTYQVTFQADWSADTHPEGFPGGAHFSPLIGANHHGNLVIWEPGGLATPGMESMAETGATSLLAGEIQSAIDAETAGDLMQGGAIDSPGDTDFLFQVDRRFPRVTLVTMIAPSPDWFLGVHGLLLFEGGRWLEERTVTLYAYDAGTDSGPEYTSPNMDTQPQEPIARLTESPFDVGGTLVPLGTFRFERVP
ncbi:Spondin domain-containing protein [Sulfidibacter corallicola]|uniref:Spondin domain-containing protein n=1 Tax=Sulfidibacter corallicola TaxID=2818388 RepID=A0A8A4TSD2_SULCO|nr:spondin domain-containing protein [Sulfidibacter corallicola]QTD49455.1 spondin domain-containing protein [Sulfidibacter corallicola]